jgi:hypothetical protein
MTPQLRLQGTVVLSSAEGVTTGRSFSTHCLLKSIWHVQVVYNVNSDGKFERPDPEARDNVELPSPDT